MSTPAANPSTLPEGYLQQDRGETVIIVAIFLIIIQTVFITLRYAARSLKKNDWGTSYWGADDWLLLPSTVVSFALSGLTICEVALRSP